MAPQPMNQQTNGPIDPNREPQPPPAHPPKPHSNKFTHSGFIASQNFTTDEYARDRFPAVLEGLKRVKADELVTKYCDYTPDMNV
jgi:hypothetical protein